MYKCPSCKAEFRQEEELIWWVKDTWDRRGNYEGQNMWECPECSETRSDIRDFEVRDEINNPR